MKRVAIVVFTQRDPERAAGRGCSREAASKAALASARATAAAVRKAVDTVAHVDVVVLQDGDGHADATGLVARGARVLPQEGGTFDARLLGGLRRVAALGYGRLVVVGTDTPDLDAEDVARAAAGDDVVVGPSQDGGFYLLGIAANEVERLAGLPWRTGRVVASLRARLNVAPVMLAQRRDLDCAADVVALAMVLDAACRRFLGASLHATADGVVPIAVKSGYAPTPTALRPSTTPQGPPRA